MARPATDRDEDGPERTCIVTRRKASPDTMIRFVVDPDATVVPDLRRKLPGRGVWVGASRQLVADAMRKQAFGRGFKSKVQVPPALDADVDALLANDALGSFAMANKAGAVTVGATKVEKAILAGAVAALVHASDGSPDGVRKLEAVLRRCAGESGRPPAASINLFEAQQLELALGRTNVIHASLAVGPAGHAFLSRCRRLIRYRSATGQDFETDAEAVPVPIGIAGFVPALSVETIGSTPAQSDVGREPYE